MMLVVASIWGWALVMGMTHLDAVTLVEIEHNREEHRLEVAVRFYPEQLERALAAELGRKISIERTKDVDRLIEKYLGKHFNVVTQPMGAKDDPPPLQIRWVGKEVDSKEVWVYFEIPFEGTLTGKTIRDSMLFEINPEQVNTVNILEGDKVGTCVLSRRNPEAKVTLRSKERSKSPVPGQGIPF